VPTSPPRPCSRCGQRVVTKGLCAKHASQADRSRGTSSQRGYDSQHEREFRRAVLEGDGWLCVLCGEDALIADHYPRTRKQLVVDGDNPNDPMHGRSLCKQCHDRHTASTSIARRDR